MLCPEFVQLKKRILFVLVCRVVGPAIRPFMAACRWQQLGLYFGPAKKYNRMVSPNKNRWKTIHVYKQIESN